MNTATTTAAATNDQDGLACGLRHMIDEAEQFLKAAAQSGDAKLDAVRDKLAAQVRQMRVQIDELEDNAVHKARQAARSADLAVQSHPYAAIGIAAAAGLLIGFFAARR